METLDSLDLRRRQIDVLKDTTEEEVLEKFRQIQKDFAELKRQRILWDAAIIMAGYQKRYVHVTQVSRLEDERNRLKELKPSNIEQRNEKRKKPKTTAQTVNTANVW